MNQQEFEIARGRYAEVAARSIEQRLDEIEVKLSLILAIVRQDAPKPYPTFSGSNTVPSNIPGTAGSLSEQGQSLREGTDNPPRYLHDRGEP